MLDRFKKHRKKTVAALAALALLTLVWCGFNILPAQSSALLARYGFTEARIENTGFHGDSFTHADIKLDPGAFSTVRALRVRPHWPGLLTGRFIGGLVVDDMRLMGEWTDNRLSIAGWRMPRLPPFPVQDTIIINGLRLDLDTPHGAIRLETKGRLTREKDGSYKTESVLFGQQHQFSLDSRWQGSFSRDGSYAIEGEILEGDIRTDRLEINRTSGWLQIASELGQNDVPTPAISGQIQIGRLNYEDIPLGNLAVTLDGPLAAAHLIVTGEMPGLDRMRLSADLTRTGGSWKVKASVTSPHAKDMLAFLVMLRQNLEGPQSDSLTGFLITPGNIERIRKELAGLKYDELELAIDGTLPALHGSLIAKTVTDEGTQRYAISLDPGKSAGKSN